MSATQSALPTATHRYAHSCLGGHIGDPTIHTDDSPATFHGTQLSSGFLGTTPEFGDQYYGTSYRVRFITAGHYVFACDLNDDLGMTITVDVLR